MNINEFKTNIITSAMKANSLVDRARDKYYINQLQGLISSLNIFEEFVKDDLNLLVLNNYQSKADKEAIQCPLDIMCKSILDTFISVDRSLEDVNEYLSLIENETYNKFPNINFNCGIDGLSNIISKSSSREFLNMLDAFSVLKHLDGHNKTLVILGPNGSGKTSFANYLKNLGNNIKVIPASKPIIATGYIPGLYNSSLNNYNQELYAGGLINQDLLLKLIIGMCSENDDIARSFMDTGCKEKQSTFEKVKSIFDDSFEVKLDNSGFATKEMRAQKNNCVPYEFNSMSDGERAAFFYIATVVAAPEHSFIIVDEPENHLNPAIYNKIWDRLIETRPDCQFIFISHTIDFVIARSNYELVKINDFSYPNKFEFKFLGDSIENISAEFIVEILGSRLPILFCEGSKSDYDYKIYESLFGQEYTIIPTGSCSVVEKSVEACNLHSRTYNIQSAIGIIDSDLKSEEEIEKLKEKKIYSLCCNEIEMLLIDERIFKKVLERTFKQEEVFESFREKFFNKMEERKNFLVRRYVKTILDEKIKTIRIDDKNNKTMEEIKNHLAASIESLDVGKLWKESEEIVSKVINGKDYDGCLRICCLEHREIIPGLTNIFVSDYANFATGLLREDKELAKHIRNKYFPDISLK